jgi:F1F0 ATPase subunit 2
MSGLALWALAGALAGAAYFRAVWATARLLAEGGSRAKALGYTVLRFGLLAVLLVLAARAGAGPLLAASLGILAARLVILPRLGRPAP